MATRQPPLSILVVDDHAASASSLARLLRQDAHAVTTAHTLTGAMAFAAGRRRFDLLICDIGLSDGDGCDLLRRLRRHYGDRPLVAIAMTGSTDERLVQECRDAGYRRCLLKPVVFTEVTAAIDALLPQAATREARNPATAEQAAAHRDSLSRID
jgi:two-component system CheB/CheR fusion protein